MTFSEGAFKNALLNEATRDEHTTGQLLGHQITLDPVHSLPETPVFWKAGSMVAAILNCAPKVVTPIMCVGAHQGNRYGITVEPTPRPVIISHEALVGTNARVGRVPNASYNKEFDYIGTQLIVNRPMLKVVPLRPEYIKDFFNDDGTTRSVRQLSKIFDGKKTVKDTLFRGWLRAAFCLKDKDLYSNADSTSQLQIEPELPATFTLEQSETFYTDLKIGFHEDDHTFGTTIANGVQNCLHPDFTPEEAPEIINVDTAADRNVRQRTAEPPNTVHDGLLQRILHLEESLEQERRQRSATPRASGHSLSQMYNNTCNAAPRQSAPRQASFEGTNLPFGAAPTHCRDNGFSQGSASTFQQATAFGATGTTNPFGDASLGTPGLPGIFGAPSGIGANGFSFGATAANGSFTFGASAPAPIQHPSVGQRIQDLIDKAGRGHLTPEDMNTFQVLKFATTTGNATPAQKSKDNLGTRAFNLCGWAHLQPHELHQLHQCNDSGWIHYNKATNKVEKESVIDTYFVKPLVKKNGRFRQILTTEFRDLILNWRLAPANFEGNKPHGGLGPLSFVTRSTAEQENLEYFRNINSLADKPTTSDIERTVPGTPKIPNNIDALITLLTLNQLALEQVIGNKAPPAREIQRLLAVLFDNYGRLTTLQCFQSVISNEIIYQLCRQLRKYFTDYKTEADVMARDYPKFNIDFLIQGIENNNMSASHSYGPIFAPPAPPKAAPQPSSTSGGRGGSGGTTTTPASRKRAAEAAAKAAHPVVRNGPGCAAINKLVADHRAKNDGKFPRLSDIRTANAFASTKDMCDEIGLKSSNCLMWGLYCSCKGRCKTTHQSDFSTFKPERALEILKKATTM
jgi:hypothetical protein